MNPQRLELYLVRWQLNKSTDIRPCLIIRVISPAIVQIAMLSAALDLFNSNQHFLIPQNHTNFSATGLKKTSYLMVDQVSDVPIAALGKRLGQLTGELAREFDKWLGV